MLGQLDAPAIRAEATQIAIRLYRYGRILANQRDKPKRGQPSDPGYLFQDHPFPGTSFFHGIGFGAPARKPPRGAGTPSAPPKPGAQGPRSLPMWDLVLALRKRADLSKAERAFLNSPDTLVGNDHLVGLSQLRTPQEATP